MVVGFAFLSFLRIEFAATVEVPTRTVSPSPSGEAPQCRNRDGEEVGGWG